MSTENPTPPAPEAPETPETPAPTPAPAPYEPMPAPPAYSAPPAYEAPPPPAPRRGRGPLIAIVLVVLLVILAGGGYVVGGFAYANGKVNSATDSLNKVIDHENALTDLFNKLNAQFNNNDPASATSDSIKQDKTLNLQLATQSKAAQPTVESDDQALVTAAASLNENSWLTALSKSSIDKSATRISHWRAALAVARTILADSILYGTFYASVDDAALDFDALDTAFNSGDLNQIDSAIQTLKSDVAKAITEDSAPGVASQMDPFLKDLQKTANDFAALVAAARAGNTAGINAAGAALDADTTKLDGYDFSAMGTSEQAFYKVLTDKYNTEVDAANKT